MSAKSCWTEVSEYGYQALLLGNFDEAEKYFRLAIESGDFAEQDVRLAYSCLVLGKCFIQRGDYVGAEPFYRSALEIYEKVYGTEHKDVASCLAGLAKCNLHRGKYTEAQLLYTRVIAVLEKLLPVDDLEIGNILEDLAQCYLRQRDFRKATSVYRRAVEIFIKEVGPDHELVATNSFNLARCYDELNEDKNAEPLFKRALEIYEHRDSINKEQIAQLQYHLGRCYHGQRDFTQADIWYRRAIAAFEHLSGHQRNLAYSTFGLATCYLSSGDYRADQTFKRCWQLYEQIFGPEDPHMAYFFDAYARLMHNTCRVEQGKQLESRAQDIRHKQRDTSTSLR